MGPYLRSLCFRTESASNIHFIFISSLSARAPLHDNGARTPCRVIDWVVYNKGCRVQPEQLKYYTSSLLAGRDEATEGLEKVNSIQNRGLLNWFYLEAWSQQKGHIFLRRRHSTTKYTPATVNSWLCFWKVIMKFTTKFWDFPKINSIN